MVSSVLSRVPLFLSGSSDRSRRRRCAWDCCRDCSLRIASVSQRHTGRTFVPPWAATHQVDVQTEYDGLFHQRRTVKIDNEVASDPCHQVPAVFGSLLGPNATWESTVGLGKVIGVVF